VHHNYTILQVTSARLSPFLIRNETNETLTISFTTLYTENGPILYSHPNKDIFGREVVKNEKSK